MKKKMKNKAKGGIENLEHQSLSNTIRPMTSSWIQSSIWEWNFLQLGIVGRLLDTIVLHMLER